jgi:hypothetical protein
MPVPERAGIRFASLQTMRTTRRLVFLIAAVSLLPLAGLPHDAAAQAALSATARATPPPGDIAQPIRDQLDPEATVVTRGANTIEVWLVRGLGLKAPPEGRPVTWENVPAGALVGAMRVERPLRDIRGLPIRPGVYTLRFALRPEDGAHIGTSPYREFLMVGPADADTSLEPVGYDGAVALAQKAAGRGHPLSLSIDPPVANPPAREILTNEAGHRSVVFNVAVTHGGRTAGALSFGLVLEGTYEH